MASPYNRDVLSPGVRRDLEAAITARDLIAQSPSQAELLLQNPSAKMSPSERAVHLSLRKQLTTLRTEVNRDAAGAAIRYQMADRYGFDAEAFGRADEAFAQAVFVATDPKGDRAAGLEHLQKGFAELGHAGAALAQATRHEFGTEHEAALPNALASRMQTIWEYGDYQLKMEMLGGLAAMGEDLPVALNRITDGNSNAAVVLKFAALAMQDRRVHGAEMLVRGLEIVQNRNSEAQAISRRQIDTMLSAQKFVQHLSLNPTREQEARRAIYHAYIGALSGDARSIGQSATSTVLKTATRAVLGDIGENPDGYWYERPSFLSEEKMAEYEDRLAFFGSELSIAKTHEMLRGRQFKGLTIEDGHDFILSAAWHSVDDGRYIVFQPPVDGELPRVLSLENGDPFILDLSVL